MSWCECVQVRRHSPKKKKSFIIPGCSDSESQICHWSISNAPPPASPRLITSFKAQKASSLSWKEDGMKKETYVVKCIPLTNTSYFTHSTLQGWYYIFCQYSCQTVFLGGCDIDISSGLSRDNDRNEADRIS